MAQQPLNFANPISQNAGQIGGGQNGGVQYSNPWQPTGQFGAGRTGFGYLTNDQVGTGQWGTGQSFQGAGRQAVISALQGSISDANPLDTQGVDEARQYLRNTLSDLPGMEQNQISSFDTQAQRGLQNLLAQHAAGAAGTGSLGSRQYGGAAGDITARAGSDYMNGLIQARANALNQGLSISQGLQGIQSGDLAQRQFQLGQGQALANGYMGLMGLDANRQAQLEGERYGSEQADKQMLNNDIMGIVQGGAMLAAGAPPMPHAGGSNGAAAAGGAGQFASTDPGSGIPYANPNYAQSLYNGNYYGNPYGGSGGF